ncbi:MAG: phosphate ABC transporter permease family protein, partial [Gammaproteobacteria bacterium]|nr:phosphate ABC transporter permease family protein [Gammaproteobacteria bacterium]
MDTASLIIVLLALTVAAYHFGRGRSLKLAAGRTRTLHSLPSYHGAYLAIWCAIPALLVVGFWSAFETAIVSSLVVQDLPAKYRSLPPERLDLVVNDIRNLVGGNAVSG